VSVRIGTRGSALALAQAATVISLLEQAGAAPEIVTIRTTGDRNPGNPAASLGVGAFVKEIETALLEHRIDLAVHSAKDLPSAATDGLVLAAFLRREDPLDVLVTGDGTRLGALPAGSIIGTGSPRRRAFLLAARPELRVTGIRGNVDTRLRKLADGEVHGLVLAAAGLARLGLSDRVTERLDASVMLPAVGQGAVAVQTRTDAHDIRELVAGFDDAPTRTAVQAERALLAALGGGCLRPIAALGRCDGERLSLDGAVLDADGARVVRTQMDGRVCAAPDLGRALAAQLLAMGAGELLLEVAS
jgi:hydroxymethylbilane synthase